MNVIRGFIFLFSILICIPFIKAQDLDPEEASGVLIDSLWVNVDLFEIDDPGRVTLTFDLKAFAKGKNKDEYQKALLGFELTEVDTIIKKEVRVKARGNSRKKRCQFPPIRLNISQEKLGNKYLDETKHIKLVTHCKNSVVYEKYILKEYLVYKLFNVISPNSFRVRLLEVDYIDTGKKAKDVHTWAFLIEPEDLLDERRKALKIKQDNLTQQSMVPSDMVRLTLFNYMIGNTDFAVTTRHNVKIMLPQDPSKELAIPIPYDFDYSGIVNATYAVPFEGLGLKSVKDRYYLGSCANKDVIPIILEEFKAKEEALLKVISEFHYLPERERKYMVNYLKEFFSAANQKNFISKQLLTTCL